MSICPPGLSCSMRGGGMSGALAVTDILSYGAFFWYPCVPSPVMTSVFVYPVFSMFSLAFWASSSIFSMV